MEGKGSIKGEVIREQHPVGPQADRERGQRREALGIFTEAKDKIYRIKGFIVGYISYCIGMCFLGCSCNDCKEKDAKFYDKLEAKS